MTPEGKRFVMVGDTIAWKRPDQVVVINWFTELRARLHASLQATDVIDDLGCVAEAPR